MEQRATEKRSLDFFRGKLFPIYAEIISSLGESKIGPWTKFDQGDERSRAMDSQWFEVQFLLDEDEVIIKTEGHPIGFADSLAFSIGFAYSHNPLLIESEPFSLFDEDILITLRTAKGEEGFRIPWGGFGLVEREGKLLSSAQQEQFLALAEEIKEKLEEPERPIE